MKKMSPEELESFIHRELRGLPGPRAPRSLEARVQAALALQARVPWYHRSWAHWPAAVRGSFLVLSTALAGSMLSGAFLVIQGLDPAAWLTAVGERFTVLAQFYHAARWVGDFFAQITGSIPSLWLWGALAAFMALNATFFGLGAAAYRTLYRKS